MMFIPRIYQAVALQEHTSVVLMREASHHLARVLRLQIGDQFILFNGSGGEFTAVIETIYKQTVTARVEQYHDKNIESPVNIQLAQGIPRGEKMDYVVQKAVELGVQLIAPLITSRCNVKLSGERWDKRLQHWRAIAISACEQCGRNRLPLILAPLALEDWLSNVQAELKLIAQPGAKLFLRQYNQPAMSVSLLIGPESGLAEQECQLAQRAGFQPLSLGPRILRTETAAIAAVTAIQIQFGDMS